MHRHCACTETVVQLEPAYKMDSVVSQDGYISQVCLADFQHKAIRGNPILLAFSLSA